MTVLLYKTVVLNDFDDKLSNDDCNDDDEVQYTFGIFAIKYTKRELTSNDIHSWSFNDDSNNAHYLSNQINIKFNFSLENNNKN